MDHLSLICLIVIMSVLMAKALIPKYTGVSVLVKFSTLFYNKIKVILNFTMTLFYRKNLQANMIYLMPMVITLN